MTFASAWSYFQLGCGEPWPFDVEPQALELARTVSRVPRCSTHASRTFWLGQSEAGRFDIALCSQCRRGGDVNFSLHVPLLGHSANPLQGKTRDATSP